MTTQMTITVPTTKPGELAYFTIEFLKYDFLTVVEEIGNATLENVKNNKLWTVK